MGVITSMIHAGQGCAMHTRLLLPERLLDAYVEGASESLSTSRSATRGEPDTGHGPLIREQQRLTVEELRAVGA